MSAKTRFFLCILFYFFSNRILTRERSKKPYKYSDRITKSAEKTSDRPASLPKRKTRRKDSTVILYRYLHERVRHHHVGVRSLSELLLFHAGKCVYCRHARGARTHQKCLLHRENNVTHIRTHTKYTRYFRRHTHINKECDRVFFFFMSSDTKQMRK